jgi:hypothetical protein
MGKHTPIPLPVITAGEAIRHTWCGVCLEPWRIRVPLYADGQPCGGLEVCMGCGSVHDQPGVYITPQDSAGPGRISRDSTRKGLAADQALSPRPADGISVRRPLLPRLAARLNVWWYKRHGLDPADARECAWTGCPWPGLYRHEVVMDGEEGTWRWVFCRKSHRAKWASENGVILT